MDRILYFDISAPAHSIAMAHTMMQRSNHTLAAGVLRGSRPAAAFVPVDARRLSSSASTRVRAEGSGPGLDENVLAQLRKAEEEAALLRKQLSDLQAEKVCNRDAH